MAPGLCRAVGVAHVVAAALACFGLPSTVVAQTPPSCGVEQRSLGGAWTTTETVAGENESLWRGSLRLLQRGQEVVGRWEPREGQPERALLGRYVNGVLQISQLWMQPLGAADVSVAPGREWVLSLTSGGALLTGYWWTREGETLRRGELYATGEATCPDAESAPTAALPQTELAGAETGCGDWDLSGTWSVDSVNGHRLRLWQEGANVLGWYEPVAGEAFRWVIDGTLRGRALALTHHLGDGATLTRRLELSADGRRLSGAWPPQFGPPAAETLDGAATCIRRQVAA